MIRPTWQRGPLALLDLGAGLVLTHPAGTVLVDCADGLARDWRRAGLAAGGPDLVLFTGGGLGQLGGLYALLGLAGEGGRTAPMLLAHGVSDDRLGNLVAAWQHSEGTRSGLPLALEGVFGGDTVEQAPFWAQAHDVGALAWTVRVGELALTFSGSAPPSPRLARAGRGPPGAGVGGAGRGRGTACPRAWCRSCGGSRERPRGGAGLAPALERERRGPPLQRGALRSPLLGAGGG